MLRSASARVLDEDDEVAVRELLATDPVGSCMLAGRVETHGTAAATLGARHWQAFCRVILPAILPALLTGFALAFARGLGEYGSVIFIAGNLPMVSEITPLMIITKLEQYDYAGATAIATVMLVLSFVLLLAINGLQAWAAKTRGVGAGRGR